MDWVHAFLFQGSLEDGNLPWEGLKVHRLLSVNSDINNDSVYSGIYDVYIQLFSKATDRQLLAREAKIVAIEEELGVSANSTMVPLTIRQRLFFGSPQAKLLHKLTKVRNKTTQIIDAIEEFESWEVEQMDLLLIRFHM